MAATGYMFSRAGINVHCIISSVGGFATPDLHSFKRALERLVHVMRSCILCQTYVYILYLCMCVWTDVLIHIYIH